MCKIIQSAAVGVYPSVYIIYHEKHRKAIKSQLYGCVNEKLLFMKTREDLTTFQSTIKIRTKEIEKREGRHPASFNPRSTSSHPKFTSFVSLSLIQK